MEDHMPITLEKRINKNPLFPANARVFSDPRIPEGQSYWSAENNAILVNPKSTVSFIRFIQSKRVLPKRKTP